MSERITTYEELMHVKQSLKDDITTLEDELMDSKIMRLSSFIFESGFNRKSAIQNLNLGNYSWIINSPIGKMASTFLISNKKYRKYIAAFVLLRVSIPMLSKVFRKS